MNKASFRKLRKEGFELRENILLDATINALGEIPFNELRLSDISNRVGVPVGTIYHYFTNKEDLLNRAFLKMIDNLNYKISTNNVEKNPKPLKSLSKVIVDFFLENNASFQITAFLNSSLINRDKQNNETAFGILSFFDKNSDLFRAIGYTSGLDLIIYGFYSALVGAISAKKNEMEYFNKTLSLEKDLYYVASDIAEIFESHLILSKKN